MKDRQNPNYFTTWRRTCDFTGVSTRTEYWTFILINLLVSFVLWIAVVVYIGVYESAVSDNPVMAIVALLSLGLLYVLGIASIVTGLSLMIRRIRDATGSGWWGLLAFTPFVGVLIILVITLMPTSNRVRS